MKIAILAGETSGDKYGALLADSIRKIAPGAFIMGTGGEKMREHSDLYMEGLPQGRMGFSGVLADISLFCRFFRKISAVMEKERPSLVIFIDNPGFNLKMAHAIGKKFPCFYYIPPKIWAHNYGRIRIIKKYIRAVVPIFHFEEEIYRSEGIPCRWFGHPARDLVEPALQDMPEIPRPDRRVPCVGLLPGSRQEEVINLLPVFVRTVKMVSQKTAVDVLLSASDADIRKTEERIMKRESVRFRIIEGAPHRVIRNSDLLLAASGTVNMEVALMEKPLIVFYKTSRMNYLLARIMVKLSVISPVNLVAGEKAVPEYIQRFPYARIVSDCTEILEKGPLYGKEKECFRVVRGRTGSGNVSARTAEFILRESGFIEGNMPC